MTVRPLHSFVMTSVSEAYCTPSSTPPRFHSSVSSFRTSMLRIRWLIQKSCSVSATSVCRTKFQPVTVCNRFIALLFKPLFQFSPIGFILCAVHHIACTDNLKEVELRTSGSFLLRILCNLEEVGPCLTAGGSPKGNTCGLSRLPPLPSTSKWSNPTCPATFF